MVMFNPTFAGCVVEDPHHSRKAGTWPSGAVASDVCSAHMENFVAAQERQAQAILNKPRSPLWFLGKTQDGRRPTT